MNWTKASAIAEILSSVAILITLVYLAIEIQQNTGILQSTSRQAQLDVVSQRLSDVINNPDLWLNLTNSEMTDAEKVKLSAFLITLVSAIETDWRQYQAGALPEADWENNQSGIIDTLSYSESRKWWDYFVSIGSFDPGFVSHLNGILDSEPIRTRLTDVRAFD